MKNIAILVLLLLCLGQAAGCATAYGVYDDKRLTDTIVDDKSIATSIKTSLLQEKFSDGWGTAVYCYYGNVFVVGEVPAHMQQKAVDIAQKQKGVRSVTTHWFSAQTSDENDFLLATKLRTNLIGAKGVNNTRIDTEVNAGRVVLLGVVDNEKEMQRVINTTKATSGVKSVKSYMMLPQ